MTKGKKKVKTALDETQTVRAFRMDNDVHDMLKEIAKAENRKIGHQLMQIIREAHTRIVLKIAS